MKRIYLAGAGLVLALAIVSPGLAQNGQSARAQEAKQSAQERVEAIKVRVAERKAELKADLCQRRQERLTNSVERLGERSSRLKTVIDTMYIRVQGFYEKGQLTVENYEELKTAVDAASADADAAISTVETFTVIIDCENIKLGEQLDGFRNAINDTKTALKTYRKALVDLISAMNNSTKAETDDETETNSGEEQ